MYVYILTCNGWFVNTWMYVFVGWMEAMLSPLEKLLPLGEAPPHSLSSFAAFP